MDTASVVSPLGGAGLGVMVIACVLSFLGATSLLRVNGKSRKRLPHDLLMAVGAAMILPHNLLQHDTFTTSVNVATVIWYGTRWWRNGGDDDTKRRLRKLGRKFQGQRRTAPQAA